MYKCKHAVITFTKQEEFSVFHIETSLKLWENENAATSFPGPLPWLAVDT